MVVDLYGEIKMLLTTQGFPVKLEDIKEHNEETWENYRPGADIPAEGYWGQSKENIRCNGYQA
ncbi:hypothetical protein A7C91_09435 [Thermococcus piezophilus]|uniref:Uncharacterized protein n=1 Tax=Thermococcus piezophilus TaxID=1712654 RepID=A0A172WIZ1_9EURY|nr:hypothetical protein A7C91_09435 [Thermococcus piezophilus]